MSKSNYEEILKNLEGKFEKSTMSYSGSLNDITTSCNVYATGDSTNKPESGTTAYYVSTIVLNSNFIQQIAYKVTNSKYTQICFIRQKFNGIWNDWTLITDAKERIATGITKAGWYRVARIDGTGTTPSTVLLSIGTNYSYSEPSNALISCAITWHHAKLTQINAVYCGNIKPITKVRVIYDSSNECFYIDAYYSLTLSNGIYVRNENFIKSNVNILPPTLITTSYTALQELTINY